LIREEIKLDWFNLTTKFEPNIKIR
jgi:hypothetical protein